MAKLKIDNVEDDKPVTLTVKLPAQIHRDLIDYADALKAQGPKLSSRTRMTTGRSASSC